MITINENYDDLIQWSRYLFRTVKIRSIADRELDKQNKIKDGIFPNEMFLLYFSLLYVTYEAFRHYSFSNSRVEALVDEKYEENIDILRRMRNSIFHPDVSAISPRQVKFLECSKSIIPWGYALTDEFEQFFYFYPENNNIFGKPADKLRIEIKKINNWLPRNSLAIYKKIREKEMENHRKYVLAHYPDKIEEFEIYFKKFSKLIEETPDSYFEPLLK